MPVGLRDNSHGVAHSFDKTGNDSRTETGMVNIGIPCYVYEVELLYAQFVHFFFRGGKESIVHKNPP